MPPKRDVLTREGGFFNRSEIVALNKVDLVPEDDRAEAIAELTAALDLADPPFVISGATGEGVDALLDDIARTTSD